MKTYTIKPLKWEKYEAPKEGDFVYCAKAFSENEDLTIYQRGKFFEVIDTLNEKEYIFGNLKDAKTVTQRIWEKSLTKHLKEIKLAPGHQF